MATLPYTLDGSGSNSSLIYTHNGTSDTVNITITDGLSSIYEFIGDYGVNGAYDTINVTLPDGWSLSLTDYYTLPTAGTGAGVSRFDVLDENGYFVTEFQLLGVSGAVTNVCFTRGAKIATPDGLSPIETLREGDLVLTRDHGPKPIRWIGNSPLGTEALAQYPDLRPIRIAAGALGDHSEMLVSPQHRMLLTGWQSELLFGEAEVLASARSLINDRTITVAQDVDTVDYFHILFDAHEIIMADGAWSESFHPAALGMGTASDATRDEVLALFPELENTTTLSARPALTEKDVAVLAL